MYNHKISAGSIPKYRQLLSILRHQILSGNLPAGEQLPTEDELRQKYGLSRGTVRKALSQLEAEHLITIEHGMGSFVRSAHPNAIPFRFTDSQDFQKQIEGATSYKVLAQEVIQAPIWVADRLCLGLSEPIIHISRLRMLGDTPIAYTTRYMVESLCPQIVEEDLTNQSVHELLVEYSELPLLRAEVTIEARLLDSEEAILLQSEVNEAAIFIERMTYTAPARPAVLYQGFFKSHYYFGVKVDPLIIS